MTTKKFDLKRTLFILLGPAIYLGTILLLENSFGYEAASAVGVSAWMITWWVTGPVGVGVGALVPALVNSLFKFTDMGAIISQYSSETVILLFGAGILTMPWAKIGLDRRIALFALRVVGPSLKWQMATWFGVSCVISTVLPNFATIALITPVAVSMIKELDGKDATESSLTTSILSPIVIGSCIGGGITPLGGAMNIIAMEHMSIAGNAEFLFSDWVLRIAPFLFIIGLIEAVVIAYVPTKIKRLEGTREYFTTKYNELGKMSRDEKIYLSLFVIAASLCFLRPLYVGILPAYTPTFALLSFGMLGFILKDSKGEVYLTFEYATKNMTWNVLFIVAGAGIMGSILNSSGAISQFANLIQGINVGNDFGLLFMLILIGSLLPQFAASTTTAGVVVPLALAVTSALGENPVPYTLATIIAFSAPQLGPVGQGIALGNGANLNEVLKRGIPVLITHIILTTVLCYLAMQYIPMFSTIPGLNL